MYQIHLSNLQSQLKIDESAIQKVVETTLAAEQVDRAELVLAIVDDERIHEVNREHLDHDYPTDVISFLYDAIPSGRAHRELRGAGLSLDGELVISAETAIREAAEYGWQPFDELTLYIVHGTLHLCGYDDQSDAERDLMRQRETAILQKFDIEPHYT